MIQEPNEQKHGSRSEIMATDKKHDHDFSAHFCINSECSLFETPEKGNIRFRGHSKSGRIHQIECCQCRKSFSEFHGTPFFDAKLPVDEILSIIEHLLEGCGVRQTSRLTKHHTDTVMRILRVVALHATVVLNHLLVDIGAREIQMDEFWTFVFKKEKNATVREKLHDGYGDRWVHLAADAVSRLIVAWKVDRRTKKATRALVQDVGRRIADPNDAMYTADQHGPYLPAVKELLEGATGKDSVPCPTDERPRTLPVEEARTEQPAASPKVGDSQPTPPSESTASHASEAESEPRPASSTNSETTPARVVKTQASQRPSAVFATVDKTFKQGEVNKIERRVQIGSWEDVEVRLEQSPVSTTINTSFIERLNGTFRHLVERVSRKTLGFSKDPDMLESHMVLMVASYNFVRPHGGLPDQQSGKKCTKGHPKTTPAMAAGLTQRPWTLWDLLSFKVPTQNLCGA